MAGAISVLGTVCFILNMMTALAQEESGLAKKYKIHGNTTKRTTGNNADWYNPNHAPVDNINVIMMGYNLDWGNPMPSRKGNDGGIRQQIFIPVVGPDEFGAYSLHSGLHFHDNLQCSAQQQTTFVETLNSYNEIVKDELKKSTELQFGFEQEVTLGVEADVGGASGSGETSFTVPPIFKRGYGSTTTDQNNKLFFEEEQGVMSITEATCMLSSVIIDKNDPPPFTTGFINAVKDLQLYLNRNEAEKATAVTSFINDWGTHYLKETIMGARLTITRKLSQKEYQDHTKSALETCMNDNWQVLLFPATVGQTTDECSLSGTESANKINDKYTRDVVTTYGSMLADSYQDWKNQEFDRPMPVKMKLSPILNLFTRRHFVIGKGEENRVYRRSLKGIKYDEIVKMMLPVYAEYCGNSDCTTPTGCGWNDNCNRQTDMCVDNDGNEDGFECCERVCYYNPCQNGVCVDSRHHEVTDTGSRRSSGKPSCMYSCTCREGYFGTHCEFRRPDADTLRTELEVQIRKNVAEYKDRRPIQFTRDVKAYFTTRYTSHDFIAICYGNLVGDNAHSTEGDSVVHAVSGGHRCVLGWTDKDGVASDRDTKMDIIDQVREAITNKGCSARNMRDRAWRVLTTNFSPKMLFVCQPLPCDGGVTNRLVHAEMDREALMMEIKCRGSTKMYVVVLL